MCGILNKSVLKGSPIIWATDDWKTNQLGNSHLAINIMIFKSNSGPLSQPEIAQSYVAQFGCRPDDSTSKSPFKGVELVFIQQQPHRFRSHHGSRKPDFSPVPVEG